MQLISAIQFLLKTAKTILTWPQNKGCSLLCLRYMTEKSSLNLACRRIRRPSGNFRFGEMEAHLNGILDPFFLLGLECFQSFCMLRFPISPYCLCHGLSKHGV